MTIKRADWAKKWAREIVKRPAADLVDEIAAALRAERKASEKRGAADELERVMPALRSRIFDLRNWREIEEGNQ